MDGRELAGVGSLRVEASVLRGHALQQGVRLEPSTIALLQFLHPSSLRHTSTRISSVIQAECNRPHLRC